MSTCPRCKGHLTAAHRCPRRPAVVIIEVALSAMAGGVAGLLVVAAVDPRNQVTAIDSIAVITGALAGVGLDRFLRN